ncbi:chromosome partitioning nuclease protein ParB [Acetobacter estunensis NRIC 0472]|uniref:Chromosome partitioning protein ParB n=1 Tax=Acetobacter estunensis TaxID=104097 RepID=A0A967B8K6_9PROT|nr:ParB N-terminal domain-containing protein [Acetobacter estunensis]NHO55124.1 chromosome partitioning protein ParB [Acetobacter estunensis]GBQ21557.1 chromosome partitioning nuclease protein ParB [Acetobacter estunensis NRIC 0472]
MTELRRVDPKTLVVNPDNPRRSAPDPRADHQLALNIKTVGLIHPPCVRELEDGRLMIVAGHRRVRACIAAKLGEIDVHVRQGDEKSHTMASVAENVVREAMSESDQWNGVLDMRVKGASDTEICRAFMITPGYLRGLSLLAQMHAPIIAAIDAGMGPSFAERNAIARTPLERQRDVWAEVWAESGEGESDPADYRMTAEDFQYFEWSEFVQALDRTELYARDFAFDEATAKEAGVVWEEDLFGQGDQDNRYCTSFPAMFRAQKLWAEKTKPDGAEMLECGEYGSGIALEGYRRVSTWESVLESDIPVVWVSPGTLEIKTGHMRALAARAGEEGVNGSLNVTTVPASTAPKERPDISGMGLKLIGEVRTQALREALAGAGEDVDPWDLVGAFLLALSANNVKVDDDHTYDPYGGVSARERAVGRVFPEGVLVRDPATLRKASLEVLGSFMNCEVSMHSGSGLPALLLGVLFGADAHMPNMAFEAFLKTYSKSGITKAVKAEGLEEKPTGKAMREALMGHVGEGRWVPEAAGFGEGIAAWKEELARKAKSAAARAKLQAELEGEDEQDEGLGEEIDQTGDEEEGEDLAPVEVVAPADEPETDEEPPAAPLSERPADPRIPRELTELARAMPDHFEVVMV